VEGSSFRLANGALTTLGNDSLAGVEAALQGVPRAQYAKALQPERSKHPADRLEIEAASGAQVADLNLWFRLRSRQHGRCGPDRQA